MKTKILVIGSLNYDLVMRVDHFAAPGESVMGSSFKTYPGGKGSNQAVACARLGGNVAMVGRVGEDSYGDALMDTLQQAGIDSRWITRDGRESSGIAMITLDATGQNIIVFSPGVNSLMSADHIQQSEAAFSDAGYLITQLETPLEAVQEGMRIAKSKGIKVVLNPAPARDLSPDILRMVDYLIPNQIELAMLTGKSDIQAGIDDLIALGVGTVIVTLGGDGVIFASGNYKRKFSAHKVDVVDTVAAGDAFVGAFTVALSEGQDAEQAVIMANAAGAISVTRPGAQPSLPSRAEVEAFLLNAKE